MRSRWRSPPSSVVFVAALATGSSVVQTAQWFGAGFWDLVDVHDADVDDRRHRLRGGDVAAGVRRHQELAAFPTNGRNAAAYVGLFSMLASLVSWSFSLIFSGLLAREVTHRVRGADYRAVGAAAYLGVGSVWALGLSSSAALIMASPASLPDAIERISGVIPLSQTLGLVAEHGHRGRAHPRLDGHLLLLGSGRHRSARHGAKWASRTSPRRKVVTARETPGEWLEYSPLLTIVVCTLGFLYLMREVATNGPSIILELNHYVFLFLIVGLLLHWRPRSFVQAIAASVAPVGGVLIQYPLVCRNRADDDRVGHRHADGPLLRGRLDARTPTR